MGNPKYKNGFRFTIHPAALNLPFTWKSPRKIFVNSMSDLFHDDIPDSYILQVAEVMRRGDWHTYQVLTKRSARLAALLKTGLAEYARLRHVWWGVSVEDRRHGLPRIDDLRSAPAAVRFLSIEPLLENLGTINLNGIHWVIVGGESGHGARPMDPSWGYPFKGNVSDCAFPSFSNSGVAFIRSAPGACLKVALGMNCRKSYAHRRRPKGRPRFLDTVHIISSNDIIRIRK